MHYTPCCIRIILLLRDIIYVRSREIIPLIIFNNDIKTHDGL